MPDDSGVFWGLEQNIALKCQALENVVKKKDKFDTPISCEGPIKLS